MDYLKVLLCLVDNEGCQFVTAGGMRLPALLLAATFRQTVGIIRTPKEKLNWSERIADHLRLWHMLT